MQPGGGPSSTGSPTAAPSATGRPSTSAKPSATGKSTARPSTSPSQGSCARNGTGNAGKTGGTSSTGHADSTPDTPDTPGTPGTGGPEAVGKGGVGEEQAAASVDRAEAAVEQAAEAVRGTRIVAPAAGTVLSVGGKTGDTVGTGTFISLGNLNELQVQAMVTESDVNRLKLGQKARITLATRNGEHHQGTVTAIAPTSTVDGQLVRYSVALAFDEPPAGLMLGQTASVTVTTEESGNDAVYVPAAAVRTRSDGTQVVTVRSGGRDSATVVRTGVRGDQYVEVVSGLGESDQVVMSGGTSGEFPDGTWPDA